MRSDRKIHAVGLEKIFSAFGNILIKTVLKLHAMLNPATGANNRRAVGLVDLFCSLLTVLAS